MTAFTYLFPQLSLSLAHQTLTFYPKDIHKFRVFLWNNDGETRLKKIGDSLRTIRNDCENHKFYHEDSFDSNTPHYHITFPFELDEEKLKLILDVLVQDDLISSDELDSYIKTYTEIKRDTEEEFHVTLQGLSDEQILLERQAQKEPQKYSVAASACKELHQQIQENAQRYFTKKDLTNYNLFFNNSRTQIEKARPALEQHCPTLNLLEQTQAKILRI